MGSPHDRESQVPGAFFGFCHWASLTPPLVKTDSTVSPAPMQAQPPYPDSRTPFQTSCSGSRNSMLQQRPPQSPVAPHLSACAWAETSTSQQATCSCAPNACPADLISQAPLGRVLRGHRVDIVWGWHSSGVALLHTLPPFPVENPTSICCHWPHQ